MEKTPCNAHAFDNLSYEANKEKERDNRDPIVEQVVDKFNERSRVGIEKYGTTLDRDDLNLVDWLNHLQEELMDATLYIQKLKNELNQNPNGIVIAKESWDKADKIIHEGFVYIKYTDLTGK